MITLIKKWAPFVILSGYLFHLSAATFASLGVALPHMIAQFNWSWSEAGLGFSLLALMVGLGSMVPAWLLRLCKLKGTFLIGGLLIIIGFVLLATTQSLVQYLLGTSIVGFGFSSCGMVPATHYFNYAVEPKKRGPLLGAYLMIGGLGGVAGPLFVTVIVGADGDWRIHWWLMTAISVVMTALAVTFISDKSEPYTSLQDSEDDAAVNTPITRQWTYWEAVRTPQYLIITAGLTFTFFCSLAVSSWAVTHMETLGISGTAAAGALSGYALVSAIARGLGGVFLKWIDAKWLLCLALVAEAVGTAALAYADDPLTIALFMLGEGFGYGVCLFATTVLLVEYFGTKKNPELLGFLHTLTTLAMLGPVVAGAIAERIGGFGDVFVGYALILILPVIATLFMKAPDQRLTPSRAAGNAR